jgi:sulfate transport system substrate-binding protein
MAKFGEIERVSVEQAFGGWEAAQKAHFADGGSFDQIYQKK